MSAEILTFPKTPLRAFVVIPGEIIHPDICEVRHGGLGFETDVTLQRGQLETIIRHLHQCGRGVPIVVHPECRRRAAA